MGDNGRQDRLKRISPYLSILGKSQEIRAKNKQELLFLMQDLKDEGNTLFKESKFKNAWQHYCYALFIARQLERNFYHTVEKEFLATLFCNASLCCLKTEDYEAALKDADMALCCQSANIKAMYRRCVALKGLGRYNEALDQAKKGKEIDAKDHFDELIDDLKKLTGQKKGRNSKTTDSEACNEWLAGTNALVTEKRRETVLKNMSSKKKKGQVQAAGNEISVKLVRRDEERDSDSTNSGAEDDDDVQFAARMQNTKKHQPVKPAVSNNVAGKPGKGGATNATKGSSDTGLGLFNLGKSKPTQEKRKISINLHWPMEGYDFRLVCRLCFIKEGEGVGGYRYRDNYPHSCSHDILIVRSKKNVNYNWLKIRPRFNTEGGHIFKYKMCMQFQNQQPCRLGELNCTFAHNHAEVSLWNLDRDKVFSISGFINEAKRQEIYSSDDTEPQAGKPEASGGQYIPGLESVLSGNRRQATPPPAQAPPKPETQGLHSTSHQQQQQQSTVGGTAGLSQIRLPSQFKQNTTPPVFVSQYQQQQPPMYYQQQQTYQTPNAPLHSNNLGTNPSMFFKPPLLNISQMKPPSLSTPIHITNPMPNLNEPPPSRGRMSNPLPERYKLCCFQCLIYTGRPWHYIHDNRTHTCAQNILTYFSKDEKYQKDVCVKVRERASHRTFKGNYVLCNSVTLCNPDLCKFKDTCSFAHNKQEQSLWKLEQQGNFDIAEFILQNKRDQGPFKGSTSGEPLVRHLLGKFGGYFRFICRQCFFSSRPMISCEVSGNTCSGIFHHDWSKSRIAAHVKNTTFTPIDEPKFIHQSAFYLLCHQKQFCSNWLENKCKYAHSLVEREVWMLERDTHISLEDLVAQSVHLYEKFQEKPTTSQGPSTGAWGTAAPPPRFTTPPPQPQSTSDEPPFILTEYCRICWGNGQRSSEDGKKDKCVRGHSNFKTNSVFVYLPTGKEIRTLSVMPAYTKLMLCSFHPKCIRPVCTHPHGQEELEVWSWMMRYKIKSLREVCDTCQEAQKKKTRKISVGESVVNVGFHPADSSLRAKSVNQIFTPGDLFINEHYCQYCEISCNSDRQWDDHCMSEKHINNVNSDREHQWNYRQPPWGQGSNLALCARHLHNQSCQYSNVPDMYNLCKYAHSQEELDEWHERHQWKQMKRRVALERHMFSYTENLLAKYYHQDNSVSVIAENLPGVTITCHEDQMLYKTEKNATYTWTFEIHSLKTLERVALLHNRHRLHFSLLGSDESSHQVAPGDIFLAIDDEGKACYKVTVYFTAGMYGSFNQWVVFDFGTQPVLLRKVAVEIGDFLQQEKVKGLREDLSFDRWTSQNREIIRAEDKSLDAFTVQLLQKYKEPVSADEVVTMDTFAELNQHNYIHKMHKLLELEEFTRQGIISRYNLITSVTTSQILEETGIFLTTGNADLFVKVNLSENLTEDTVAGRLVLYGVRKVLLAPVTNSTNRVCEATVVSENNFGYDGRGKNYIYLVISASSASALGLSSDKKTNVELQFQLDRKFFCRMHYALDSLQTMDVVFPDVMKFRPSVNQLSSATKFRSSVLNDDQMTAVRHIVVERDGYTPPFIMYGPFGTGKTETLAQAVMTLLKERKNVKILICTQSNSAADLYITKHLDIFFKKSGGAFKLLRVNAPERSFQSVPPEVLPYCYAPNGKEFEIPSNSHVLSHHVILTTVENSMQLSTLQLQNCFTHIFVDEAGQTLECEILMPLTLASAKTCVVLTGDHHQIGPQVYSQEARRQKFDVSILVRLYNFYEQIAKCGILQVAEKSQQSPLNIFLSINYRTKLEILRFISSVFYRGPDNLKAYGQIPSVMGITPLMFYAVQGPETQNADSTSYFNHPEAQEVVERVRELLENWPEEWGQVDATKVGIISTYSDQIKHIRKLLRQHRQQPYLAKVDVGPITSFQGKEVRALFISTVRTASLLEEPHIIRSLEDGNDIGDLGFMSNPKLLNTALTRTQSFVAVVGDPLALCLIGECIQVWRTYLKHCSNMKSVRPYNVTYDFVKNQVISIQLSPSGKVVEMISQHTQDSFRQIIRPKVSKVNQKQEQDLRAGGDQFINVPSYSAVGQYENQNSARWHTVNNPDQQLPTVKSSRGPEHRQHLRQSKQFSSDKLALNSTINCEDIIFQLAKENQRLLEGDDSSPIKSEGISISETEDFAVLIYDLQGNRQRSPFKIISEDEDFDAFIIHDEDANTDTVYENYSIETLSSKLESAPHRFVKCTFHTEGDRAYATVIGPHPPQWQAFGEIGHDLQIRGQLNRGHALNGDEVVVELCGRADNGILEGQVKGILKRAQDPSDKLYMCTADPENAGILTPLNHDMPRIYSLTTSARIKLARKGHACVYKFVSSSCIEFSHYEPIDSTDSVNRLFIVRYLTWQPGFTLPLGVVVGMLTPDFTLNEGMEILEIEHNIHRTLHPQAMEESERLFPPDFTMHDDLLMNRQDLTQKLCFSVSNPLTEDLELAFSVTQSEENYEMGIHVPDVVAFIDKHSVLDQECEHRGASFFPMGKDAIHMLPAQASRDLCSLKPGFNRLAISVTVQVNQEGKIVGHPDVFRSVICSKQCFTHAEVEEILLNPEDSQSDYLKSCIVVLYQLSYIWRCERLGNAHFNPDLQEGNRSAMHSYLMMNEVKILFNSIVADTLLSRFAETTPLLVQPAPQRDKLEVWRRNNASHAFNSIPLARAFLDDKVCDCTRTCTCVFSYMRHSHLQHGDYVSILKEVWSTICASVGEEDVDFELAQELISNPENLPQLALAAQKLKAIQQPVTYICSQHTSASERRHYSLCVQAYTNFTSPLRRFMSMVVQRLLVAYIEGSSSPYGSSEVAELCAQATITEREVDKFHQDVFILHLASALQAHPLILRSVVEEVDKIKVTISFLGVTALSGEKSILLSHLSPVSTDQLKPGCVQLSWEKRVYSAGQDPPLQHNSELKLQSDRFVCNIPVDQWQQLLIAVREKDEAAISASVQEITRQIGGDVEQLSKNYPEVLSDMGKDGQMRHYVPFNFTIHENQTLMIQLSAHMSGGLLAPNLQLLNLTPCLDVCLEHEALPSKCFAHSHVPKQVKRTYKDEQSYATDWLLPILGLESAQQAVKDGERITIHNINIVWSGDNDGDDQFKGEFVLAEEFCNRSCFHPDLGNTVAAALLDRRSLYNTDPNFSLDFLCVRYRGLVIPEEPALDESIATLVNTDQPITWVAHCLVKDVSRLSEGYRVKISLKSSSMKIPKVLLQEKHTPLTCTVEWIHKTNEQRVMDIAVRGLQHTSSFVKDIVLGKKPVNTIDPVPQDKSVLKSTLSESQETVISECYRQPFTAVIGGPGTGKSRLAAHLAHLLIGRNRTADNFRQTKQDGYTTQVMICAPSEKSLDVITEYLIALNHTGVHIVRVYSEEVEERDYPMSLAPKPNDSIKPPTTCAVMKDVALHHLIRGVANPESRSLLEQEMMLTMYGRKMATTVHTSMQKAQVSELKKARVILCTCITSARTILRQTTNVKQIIMDDASLISEAEALVPLVAHRGVNQLVLLGDTEMPHPQSKKPIITQCDLSRSILQRYVDNGQKLTMQYRSIPTLCSFPSSYFYSSELTTSPQAPLRLTAPTIQWPGEAGFPSVFCHVTGQESFSGNTNGRIPSEHNITNSTECHAVNALVGALTERHKVKEASILVLTMTQAQATLIRSIVPQNVRVSTVMDSIGHEAEYVILSTVRSFPESGLQQPPTSEWINAHLGQVANPQLVNLAITRAKAALIIFGNKNLLNCCKPWKSLLSTYRQRQSLQSSARDFIQSLVLN